jgi:DNA polymerase (family 10)
MDPSTMPMSNAEIAEAFREMADLLEISGGNPFRVRAYRTAAVTIQDEPRALRDMVANGDDLTALPGIGPDLSRAITQLVQDGQFPESEAIKQQIDPGVRGIMRIPGLGPKRVRALHDELGIKNVDDLQTALNQNRLAGVSGFSQKLQDQIAQALERGRTKKARRLISEIDPIAIQLQEYLRAIPGVTEASVAGSWRRRRETVGDLDSVAASHDPARAVDAFTEWPPIAEIVGHGETRASVVLHSGIAVDFRAVKPEHYGAAMIYFTGSRDHQLVLRNMAIDRGWKMNEYAVYASPEETEIVASRTEEDVYAAFGLAWIPPELRENHGEIAAAANGTLPTLIEQSDIRGDLHCHTTWSDGKATVLDMAKAAQTLGYDYIAITDHSPRLAMTNGLNPDRLKQQAEEIAAANDALPGFTILRGQEVDILKDGSLDQTDAALDELDVVICSVHSHFDLSREEQTARLIRTISHPAVTIIGHPQGRLLERREGIQLDLEAVFEAAVRHNVAMEINADPHRLDLNDTAIQLGKKMGVTFTIDTDAHSPSGFRLLRYGIDEARRGWLEKPDVLNTRDINGLLQALGKGIKGTRQ